MPPSRTHPMSTDASIEAGPDPVHLHQIDDLAAELSCDEALVADVYWSVLERLERSSRVKDFLPVFAARKTREALRRIVSRAGAKPH